MTEQADTDRGGTPTLDRRRLLRAIGGSTAGIVAVSGTASAHQNHFFGCQEVCTDTDGNLAVVAVDGGFDCRPITQSTDRDDVPWDWTAHCYRANDEEVIVGLIEEHVWEGPTHLPDGHCELCLNPNVCAQALVGDLDDVAAALNERGCSPCEGSVVPATDCRSTGDNERGRSGTPDGGQEETKLTATNGAASDRFGWTVAVDRTGRRILVGAPKTDRLFDRPSVSGTAFVFDYDGTDWTQTATLTASDATAGDAFGWDVSLTRDGEMAMIGAPATDGTESEAGAAYVFERDGGGWTETAKVTATDGASFDRFGAAVTVDDAGDTALVGAPLADPMGAFSAGVAYAFQLQGTTWTQVDRLLLNVGDNDAVGSAVAIDSAGDDGIVSGAGAGPSETGFASIVSNGTAWSEGNRFQPATLEAVDRFGADVSLDETATTAVAGAPGDDVNGIEDQGSTFVFVDDGGWSQEAMLTASDGVADDEFGTAVAVDADGDLLLVGAPGSATAAAGVESGATYAFTRAGTTWTEAMKLTPSVGDDGDLYGAAVAVDDDRQIAVVGAPGDDSTASDAGAVYVTTL